MARRQFPSRITTQANTTAASPLETAISLPRGTLERITVVIPSGHAGLTGLALQYAGEHVWPWGPNTWLEGDDEVVESDIGFSLEGANLIVRTYNTDDTFDHDHLIRLVVLDPRGQPARSPSLLVLAPASLDLPAEGSSDQDVPVVGDELAGVTPEGGEIVVP